MGKPQNDSEPVAHIAKIEDTRLGYEDHGIMVAYIFVTYGGGGGQGIGGHVLDTYDREREERIGTAYGMEYVKRILIACGVDEWEKLKGRTIFVYKEDDRLMSKVLGIGPLPTEPGKPFYFEEIKEFIDAIA